MSITFVLIYLIIGLLGGLIIGLVGAGSSLVILPILAAIFVHLYPHGLALKMAAGTSIATIFGSSTFGAISQRHYSKPNHKVVAITSISYVLSAFIGANISHYIPSLCFHRYVGGLLIFIALWYLLVKKNTSVTQDFPHPMIFASMACLIAIISAIAGIALGLLMIPFLSRYLPHKIAKATSIASAISYTIFGTFGYVYSGYSVTANIPWTLGYVNIPVFACIAITIWPGTQIGMKMANQIDIKNLKLIFYLFLVVAGVYIAFFVR